MTYKPDDIVYDKDGVPIIDDTPPPEYTWSMRCLDGEITIEQLAARFGWSMDTAQGCVDVVKGWRDAEAEALENAAKGDGIPF